MRLLQHFAAVAHRCPVLLAVCLVVSASLTLLTASHTPVGAATQPTPPLDHPDAVCATCHAAIYARYEKSAMARGSGMAAEALIPGSYHHDPSGVDYRIFRRDGVAYMSYSRNALDPRGELSGEVRLDYYIGSNTKGRTYIFHEGQQWYELPINFYAARGRWEMAPAYQDSQRLPAPLPTDPGCLHCHSSLGQPALITARNSFATTPFRQGGIGCTQCHGDPAAHLAAHGHEHDSGTIINPAKLDAARRDSICTQCHLEGEAMVPRSGKSLVQFVPGDNLSDLAVYFVRASRQAGGARATSQYEALLQSACKRAVGDRLTCTTCHDPHGDPDPADRVAYFRARCLTCHASAAMATHHTEQPDCAACHMPSRKTADISHAQTVDHDIERVPATRVANQPSSTRDEFVTVGHVVAGDREFGLAYAQAAATGMPGAADTARRLLASALVAGVRDVDVDVRLAYLDQRAGEFTRARSLYTAALEQNPYEPTALSNLAVLDASSGRVAEAARLLERLILYDPSQTSAGLNLAWIECSEGKPAEAATLLHRLQRINPDDPTLKTFLLNGDYAGGHCSPR